MTVPLARESPVATRSRPAIAPRGSVPRWWPARWYYGWALVVTLGLTATISYGTLSYALTAFVVPMGAELGWTKTQVTGAFSLAQLVAGVAAVPVGHWVDRHGARSLMTAGSVLSAALLLAWSRVETIRGFYAIFAALGVAMAAVLYEPAFAVVATWFRRGRSRALTLLTFLGGFASVVFVPLAAALVARHGWRETLAWLALVVLAGAALPHAVVLRRRPADVGLAVDGTARGSRDDAPGARRREGPHADVRAAVRGAPFRWMTAAFALSALATTAVGVHLVPLLVERGHGLPFAGAAMGLLGLMALPGRLVFTPLGERFPRAAVTASIFVLQALSALVLLLGKGTWAIWAFVALFGAGFGAITPARAALVADTFGAESYGRVGGAMALVLAPARAAAPVGASLLYAAAGGPSGGYDAFLVVLLISCAASALAVLRVREAGSSGVAS